MDYTQNFWKVIIAFVISLIYMNSQLCLKYMNLTTNFFIFQQLIIQFSLKIRERKCSLTLMFFLQALFFCSLILLVICVSSSLSLKMNHYQICVTQFLLLYGIYGRMQNSLSKFIQNCYFSFTNYLIAQIKMILSIVIMDFQLSYIILWEANCFFFITKLYLVFLSDQFFQEYYQKKVDLILALEFQISFLQTYQQISFNNFYISFVQSLQQIKIRMNQHANSQYDTFDKIIQKIKKQNLYLIGVCGIPGSGKSSISQKLTRRLQNSLIIPMDGFHLYRKDLNEQGIRRRGAIFTFNLQSFENKMLKLKQKKQPQIYFPSFDHQQKDPKQNTIMVDNKIKHVIVQGLYIFDKSLKLEIQWDLKIFINQSIESCIPRLTKRCIQKKMQNSQENVKKRVQNDMKSAKWVLQNSNFNNCHFIKNEYQDNYSQFKDKKN